MNSATLKQMLCYLTVFMIGSLSLWLKSSDGLILALLLLVGLSQLDGDNELFPDRSWKINENGNRYRVAGAGRNIHLEYHVGDQLKCYQQRLENIAKDAPKK